MVMVVASTIMWMTSLKTRFRLMEDTLTASWASEDIVGGFEGDKEGGGGDEEEEDMFQANGGYTYSFVGIGRYSGRF